MLQVRDYRVPKMRPTADRQGDEEKTVGIGKISMSLTLAKQGLTLL